MAVNLSPIGGVAGQFFTNNGTPLSGGKIYTYAAGSSTPATTYTTAAGNVAHTNPIVLDSGGRVPTGEIWLTDGVSYKFVIKTSADVLIGTYDNIIGINSNFVNYTNSQEIQTATAGQTLFTLTGMAYQPGTNSLSVFVDGVNQYGPGAQYAYVETSSTEVTFTNGLHVGAEVKFTTSQLNSSAGGDASQVSYTPAGTGAVPTTVQAKLRQTVSVMDFGAVGDGVVDDTVAINAALAASVGKTLIFPAGTYLYSDTLSITNHVIECSPGKTILKASNFSTAATALVDADDAIDTTIYGATFDCTFFTSANQSTYPLLARFVSCSAPNFTLDTVTVLGDATFDIEYGVDNSRVISTYNYITVKNCTVNNIKGNALGLFGKKVLATGNRIYNVPKHSSIVNRAVISGIVEELIFTDNYIEQTEWVSTIYDSVAAIDVGGGDRIVISNNIFKNVALATDFESGSGVGVSADILCTNNVFVGDGTHGVGGFVNFNSSAEQYVVISNNYISGFDYGILATQADKIVITGNTLFDNVTAGISMQETSRFNISGNEVTQSSGTGISTSNTPNEVVGGSITSNVLYGTFTTDAIYVYNQNGATIVGPNLIPIETVVVANNNVIDGHPAVGDRVATITQTGNVTSTGNTINYPPVAYSGASIAANKGNYYTFSVSGANTLSSITDGAYGQEIEIVFSFANGASLTIDFTSSNLIGNNGVDQVFTSTGYLSLLVKAKYVFAGYGTGKWLCQIASYGY